MSGHASAFGVINFPPNIQEVRVSIIDVRQGAYQSSWYLDWTGLVAKAQYFYEIKLVTNSDYETNSQGETIITVGYWVPMTIYLLGKLGCSEWAKCHTFQALT